MSDTLSLTDQLAARVSKFLAATSLSQKELARLLRIEKSHFSRFLSGKVGLSAETTLKLLQLMSLSPRSLQLKFGNPEKTQARLLHLQENGTQMRLDSGGSWVPGQSGDDPNGTDDVTGVRTALDLPNADDYQQETIDFLKDQKNIHRSAIKAIDDYLAGIQKGKVNSGPTSPARRINDNDTSSKPGPRGDLLSDPDKLREHLAFVQREREKAEETVKLQKKLEKERELLWAARG